MKRFALLAAFILCIPHSVSAQDVAQVPQFLDVLKPRCIGPANMSGRITEVAVYEKEPRIMYVASASGGLWKTINNGTTWTPVFERESTVALGAVAVCQSNPDLVWVGTGEANARNSVSWGDGVYRSADGGKTWKNMGLKATEHIGRIVIHPKDPDTVYVAALGKLWAPNKERGIFKTTDGGKTWEHVLATNNSAGCIDLAMHPDDPDLVYAAMYHVRRDAFSGGNPAVQTGPGSGLFKTTDAGKNWTRMAGGLPDRALGRCGFSIYRKNPNVVYAVVQTDKTPVPTKGQPANEKLDLDLGGIFRSDDKGKSWTHVNSLVPRPFYYGQIRVDPNDDQRVYVLGVQFHVSTNGGKKFRDGNGAKGTHVDYHALWINPRDSHHLVLGCDGGMNFSYDKGTTWEHLKNLPVSQFYAVGIDNRKPYRVFGGLQDNGTWGGPSRSRDRGGISSARWFNLLGYDGYYCVVHPKDNDLLYCEGQWGWLHRVNVAKRLVIDIRPRLVSEEEKTNFVPPLAKNTADFRFNWSSPIVQSPWAEDEIFYAGNHVFVSKDRGDSWRVISPDLTRGKPGPNDYKGHTISALAASRTDEKVLYAGTDDGNLWVCRSWNPIRWTNITDNVPNVPKDRWISRLEPSHYEPGTVYLTIDRHRHDDRKPYVFKTTDFGATWTSIASNLPDDGPAYVIREHSRNTLYVGTEFGLFISIDDGKTWHKQKHLPTVPVHDLVIHERESELVIGTHGRGIWIMDVLPIVQMEPKDRVRFFPIRAATAYRHEFKHDQGIKHFAGENPPNGAVIYYYLPDKLAKPPSLTIVNAEGKLVAELKASAAPGLQRVTWNLNRPGTKDSEFNPVPAGNYTVVMRIGESTHKYNFVVEVDD